MGSQDHTPVGENKDAHVEDSTMGPQHDGMDSSHQKEESSFEDEGRQWMVYRSYLTDIQVLIHMGVSFERDLMNTLATDLHCPLHHTIESLKDLVPDEDERNRLQINALSKLLPRVVVTCMSIHTAKTSLTFEEVRLGYNIVKSLGGELTTISYNLAALLKDTDGEECDTADPLSLELQNAMRNLKSFSAIQREAMWALGVSMEAGDEFSDGCPLCASAGAFWDIKVAGIQEITNAVRVVSSLRWLLRDAEVAGTVNQEDAHTLRENLSFENVGNLLENIHPATTRVRNLSRSGHLGDDETATLSQAIRWDVKAHLDWCDARSENVKADMNRDPAATRLMQSMLHEWLNDQPKDVLESQLHEDIRYLRSWVRYVDNSLDGVNTM